MNRYLSSFILSAFIYISLFAGAFAFISEDSDNFSDKDVDKPHVISVCMVTPEKPKPVKKKTSEKKVKKKKIVKQTKPEPKPKKTIAKKELVKKEEIKEEVAEEKIATQESAETPIQQVIANKKSAVNHDEIKAKQNIFFTKLRNKINENKSYPRGARRRGIQGSVEVRFNLCRDGNVKNIEFLSGKNIFKESVIEAIENSFPIEVDETLFVFPKEFKISVDYILS
jgi:protein TonB